MRKILFLALLLCGLAWMTGCNPFAGTGGGTTESTLPQSAPVTEPETVEPVTVTEPETEPPTPETSYFPNEPDDDHTKRY